MKKTPLEARRKELIEVSKKLDWLGRNIIWSHKKRGIGNRLIKIGKNVVKIEKQLQERMK